MKNWCETGLHLSKLWQTLSPSPHLSDTTTMVLFGLAFEGKSCRKAFLSSGKKCIVENIFFAMLALFVLQTSRQVAEEWFQTLHIDTCLSMHGGKWQQVRVRGRSQTICCKILVAKTSRDPKSGFNQGYRASNVSLSVLEGGGRLPKTTHHAGHFYGKHYD